MLAESVASGSGNPFRRISGQALKDPTSVQWCWFGGVPRSLEEVSLFFVLKKKIANKKAE
jgi:hypothetical protein